MKKIYFVMALLIVAAFVLVACGGGTSSSGSTSASVASSAADHVSVPEVFKIKIVVNHINPETSGWKTNVVVFSHLDKAGTKATLVWSDGFKAKIQTGVENKPFVGHPVTEATLKIGDKSYDLSDPKYNVISMGTSNAGDVTIIIP